MLTGQLEHLRADVALDQAENIGVRAALDLAPEARLGVGQEIELVDERKPVRQELVRVVEFATADHVRVDVPAHAL